MGSHSNGPHSRWVFLGRPEFVACPDPKRKLQEQLKVLLGQAWHREPFHKKALSAAKSVGVPFFGVGAYCSVHGYSREGPKGTPNLWVRFPMRFKYQLQTSAPLRGLRLSSGQPSQNTAGFVLDFGTEEAPRRSSARQTRGVVARQSKD